MLIIAAMLALQLLVLTGLGKLFLKLTGIKEVNRGLVGIWGIVFATLLASALSLVMPLSQLSLVLIVVGLVSVLFIERKKPSIFAILLFLAMLFPIYISVPQYDTGLYHLPQVLWERSDALPVGLANLHSRLGFNSLWLTFAASMSFGPNWIVSTLLVNASLFFFTLLYFWEMHGDKKQSIAALSVTFLWFVLGSQLNEPADLGGPNTDFSSQIFGIFGLIYFLKYFTEKSKDNLSKSIFFLVFSSLLKFSNVGFALVPVLFSLWKMKAAIIRERLFQIALFVVIIWLARSLVLTGCVIPVISETCMDVSWSAEVQMEFASSWAKAWSRYPGMEPELVNNSWQWLEEYWLEITFSYPMVKLLLGLIAVSAALVLLKKSFWAKHFEGLGWLFVSLGFGFTVWFLSAPDFRFVYFYVVFTCSVLLSALLGKNHAWLVQIFKILFLALIVYYLLVGLYRMFKYREQLTDPWPRFETPSYQSYDVTDSAHQINVPIGTDKCFDIPWCTPEYSDQIRVTEKWGRLVFTRKQD